MRLVLVASDGVAETIMIDVEQYNWSKYKPRQILITNLREALEKARERAEKERDREDVDATRRA